MDDSAGMAGGMMVMGCVFIFAVGLYAFVSYCLMMIAQKTDTENAWMAWIPIANLYLMCIIAGRPGWWLLLCFLPIANIVVPIILWMDIAEVRGKPNWWGLLMFVPFVNFYILYALAFQD